ncbi:hypothetical protein [Streptomyces ortus]|uniref:4Fe-4S ferredoxin-type domain-containing protein n=1 Tax=Streptomyces ortus TaxID=2867268 RepID=A0ABT3UWX9_9ACTN|nr:hypothetical protein [Streptomyces ortus]MCX4232075.1 hypothetical protein [Streptomyces ortus]
MNQPDPTTDPETARDFDGCRRDCRLAQAHTLVWGECEHAPKPEPTVNMSVVYTAADGHPSIGFDTYTVPELARLIEPAAGDALRAAAVARAIVHRNDEQPPAPAAPAVPSAPASRAAHLSAAGERRAALRERLAAVPAAEEQPDNETPDEARQSCACGQDGCEHCDTDEEPLLCPRCGDDISDYGEDDFVFRTGDDRPYCSGECVVAAHRAALKAAPPAVVPQPEEA